MDTKFTKHLTEATKFKVGDRVIPNTGPMKGVEHEVIHVFDNGEMNIKPMSRPGGRNAYRHGAAKARPDQVKLKKA